MEILFWILAIGVIGFLGYKGYKMFTGSPDSPATDGKQVNSEGVGEDTQDTCGKLTK